MQIHVTLHSFLREKLAPEARGKAVLELDAPACVQDVIERLGLPEGAAWSLNEQIGRDTGLALHEGDSLRFFRPGAGG